MFTSPRKMIDTAFKLFALCIVVGIVMAILGINDPLQVWGNFLRWIKDIWNNMADWLKWLLGYAALGAGIVLPVYLHTPCLAHEQGVRAID